MTVTLDIPKDIEARLAEDARSSGVALSDFTRNLIIDYYEEGEDRRIAEARLAEPLSPVSAEQTRKNLGLDD